MQYNIASLTLITDGGNKSLPTIAAFLKQPIDY